MRLLLDAHILIRSALLSDRLPAAARALITDTENDLFFSAASIWEVAPKRGLGRPDFTVDAGLLRRGLLDNGYAEIPVTSHHGAGIARLPPIHQDPFDRILIAHAIEEEITLLTADPRISAYLGPYHFVST